MTKSNKAVETLALSDALGDDIVVGNLYGFTLSKSGIAHTIVGKAVRATRADRITLQVVSSKRYLYGQRIDDYEETAGTVSVFPCMIFPVRMKRR